MNNTPNDNKKGLYKGPAVNRSKIAAWYNIGNDLLNEWLEEIADKIKLKKFKKVLSPRQICVLFEEYGEPDWDKGRLNTSTNTNDKKSPTN